jgi:metallo-beta-lactamase family protein
VDGAKSVRIFRESYPVRAKLFTINGLSAHADRDALLGWIGGFRRAPRQTWVVHGEPLAAESLKNSIIDGYGWRANVARFGERCSL